MNARGEYGQSYGSFVGAERNETRPSQPSPTAEKPVTWGNWVVYGLAGVAVVGVGLMVRSAYKSMARTDETFRSKGLKGPFGT